jgi:thiol:disulfide interchange protein
VRAGRGHIYHKDTKDTKKVKLCALCVFVVMLKFSQVRSGGFSMRKLITVLLLVACSNIGSLAMAQQKSKSLTNDDFPAGISTGKPKNDTKTQANLRTPASERTAKETTPVLGNWLNGADGYNQALQEYKSSGRPMIVYFYTDWCGYCKLFNRDYLASKEVEQYLKSLVKVRINPEKGPSEKALSEKYGAMGYPSFFIVSANSSKPQRVHPFLRRNGQPFTMSTAQFIQACKEAGGQ